MKAIDIWFSAIKERTFLMNSIFWARVASVSGTEHKLKWMKIKLIFKLVHFCCLWFIFLPVITFLWIFLFCTVEGFLFCSHRGVHTWPLWAPGNNLDDLWQWMCRPPGAERLPRSRPLSVSIMSTDGFIIKAQALKNHHTIYRLIMIIRKRAQEQRLGVCILLGNFYRKT